MSQQGAASGEQRVLSEGAGGESAFRSPPAARRPPLLEMAYPPLYAAADALAERHQDTTQWLVRVNLLLIVASTTALILAALNPLFDTLFPAISAVLLAIGFIMQIVRRRRPVDRVWFNGRALAEAVKGASWRYVEGAKPYDGSPDAAAERFAADLLLLRDQYGGGTHGLGGLPHDATRPTAAMRTARALPLPERKAVYLRDRADEQIGWYTRKATENRRLADRLFWVAQAAQAITVVVAFGRAIYLYPYAVIGFFSTFISVATAWSQSGRHGDLASTYAATADALNATRPRLIAAEADAALDEAVTGIEDAIAREQSAWIIRRT